MAKSSISVIGIPRALGRIEQLSKREHAAVEEAVKEEVEEVASEMRRDAPVGDGRRGRRGRPSIAESIEESVSGLSGEAKATAKHAWVAERGTKSHPAQPFAGPASERARKRFPQRVTKKILKANNG